MHKNTMVLTLNGKEYAVKPNFTAAASIQARCNKSLPFAVMEAKQFSVTALHAILCGALEGGGHPVSEEYLGDVLIEDYRTEKMVLVNALVAFGEMFFPAVENDGTKKPEATTTE